MAFCCGCHAFMATIKLSMGSILAHIWKGSRGVKPGLNLGYVHRKPNWVPIINSTNPPQPMPTCNPSGTHQAHHAPPM